MIGCFGHATSDEYFIDEDEIAEARWFTREEVRLMLERRHPEAYAALAGRRSPML